MFTQEESSKMKSSNCH